MLKKIEELGIEDDTYIIYMSDNSEELEEKTIKYIYLSIIFNIVSLTLNILYIDILYPPLNILTILSKIFSIILTFSYLDNNCMICKGIMYMYILLIELIQ